MADQITIEQALELVEFELRPEGWRVKNVKGSVYGDVCSNVYGNVCGDVYSSVCGSVLRNVYGNVCGTISCRQWKLIETPREKLKRLIEEGADKDTLLAAVDQLEDN